MLTIRAAQMSALRSGLAPDGPDALASWLVARLRADPRLSIPLRVLDDLELSRIARAALDRAASHGIAAPDNQAAFAMLVFAVGPDFDLHPVVKTRLADPYTSEAARMQVLAYTVPARVWRKLMRPTQASALLRWLSEQEPA